MKLKLQPHSVGSIKVPTEFAKFKKDMSVYEKSYVDCSGCENIDAPRSVIEKLSNAIKAHPELIWDHWDAQDMNLRKKIASYHKVSPEQVFITSGALAGIEHCFKIFTKEGTKTGLLKPDWPGFEHFAEFYRNQKFFTENFKFPFTITAEQISDFIKTKDIEFIVLANPMPLNGNQILKKDVNKMLKANRGTLFVIDEADTIRPDMQGGGLVNTNDNAIFLGSLSKFYGLSGLRIGYLISPKAHVKHFRNTITVAEVSSLAVLAGNIVWDDKGYQKQTQDNVIKSIKILTDACKGTSYKIAATPYCFACYLYSEKSNPKKDLEKFNIKILEGQFFGLPGNVNGGRFNLSDPKNADLLAEKIRNL